MIRVELLGRQQRWWPWSKALLSALVVCGGLYGLYHVLYSGSAPSPVVQQAAAPPSSIVPQAAAPSPIVPQAAAPPSPVVPQAAAPSPIVPQATPPSPVAQREITPESVAEQATPPSPAAVPQEIEASPATEQEPAIRREASAPTTAQRSTACHQAMRIVEQVPAGIRLASLNCNSTGEYWLEGASPSHKALRAFRLRLQALPSRVSFSTWREERTLRFAFQGRFAERTPPPQAALSSGQAEQFLGEVAGWADASGLDSLSIHEPIHVRHQQRQKLRGIGAPQQIDAFLQQFQQAEGVATLGEVLLMPVKSDEHGWVTARLYAAVDIVVEAP